MEPGHAGPPHTADAEQIWTVLTGAATARIGDAEVTVEAGDTVVIPAGAERRIRTGDAPFAAVVSARAGFGVYRPGDPERIEPAWAR
jgi:quercetin dioxygenase-like cupin family protein